MRRLPLAALCLLATGCVLHSHSTEFHGMTGLRGEPIEYQISTAISLRLVYFFDLWGDASKQKVIDEFTEEAAERGGTRIRITQTTSTTYWYMLLPLTFIIHPVVTSVEGDVEGTLAAMEEHGE